MDIVIVIGSIA